jgi:hypothetical protein
MLDQIFFNYQSSGLSLEEWMALLTLCIAPLAAHIIAGVPAPTYLHNSVRPSWHDHMCLYNPTSIIWRYFAITDRRLRARAWTAVDMAASNAIFWVGCWDGSEEMIQKSRNFCTRPPNNHHIEPISGSSVITIVVTLQGVQALYALLRGRSGTYSYSTALGTIFFPLAVFGLLRLPAALWLTDNYAYRNAEDWDVVVVSRDGEPDSRSRELSSLEISEGSIGDRFHSPKSWRGLLLRGLYLLAVLGLMSLSLFFLGLPNQGNFYTATNLALNVLFILFLAVTLGTIATYFLLGRSTTTIIPCIVSRWYKIYTGTLFAFMLLVFIIAALETRKKPCGKYTTYAERFDNDQALCGNGFSIHINPAKQI